MPHSREDTVGRKPFGGSFDDRPVKVTRLRIVTNHRRRGACFGYCRRKAKETGRPQTPMAGDAAAVPEPAVWTLLVIGLVVWFFGRRTCAT